MTTVNIRRNSYERIKAHLEQCLLITCHRQQENESNVERYSANVEEVVKSGKTFEFSHVYVESDRSEEWSKIVAVVHENWFYTGYRTKEDAKGMLSPSMFEKYFPIEAQAERDENEKAYRAALKEEILSLANAVKDLTTDLKQITFLLGQRIEATFATNNKVSSIGHYIRECKLPRKNARGYTNWNVIECKIKKIISLNTEEYDEFVIDLLKHRPELFDGFGGQASDYKVGRIINSYSEMTVEEKQLWDEDSYVEVAVIEAPLRKTFIVNPEGYEYARYVGLDPMSKYSV